MLGLSLIACGSRAVAAPVSSTVSTFLTTSVTQTATVTTVRPDVTVTRTVTKAPEVDSQYQYFERVLGLNRLPSSGEVQIVYACEHDNAYLTPGECDIVHEEWDD